MDERRNRKIVSSNATFEEGDLVQITIYNFPSFPYGNEEEFIGIVIYDEGLAKLKLFPQIAVYMLKSNTVQYFMPNYLKIISPKTT